MYWNSKRKYTKNKNIWLIETWDVLKWWVWFKESTLPHWLIETWDVLKYLAGGMPVALRLGLIETWDVLKWEQFKYAVLCNND